MANRQAKVVILALSLGLAGCATTSASTPDFGERDLRPMNQDLAAWLARLNAVPAEPAASVTPAAPTVLPDTTPAPALALSTSATPEPLPPSPGPAVPKPATATPPPVPASADVAGTSSSPGMPADTATAADRPAPAQDLPEIALTFAPKAPKGLDAPAEVAPALPALPPPDPWLAGNGASLRGSVEAWGKRAAWTVVWDAPVDYPIAGTLTYEGDFLEAIRGLFRDHASVDRPLQADVYLRQQLIHVTE